MLILHLAQLDRGLNPCFNGRWSRTFTELRNFTEHWVLILVLMEDGLGLNVKIWKEL